MATEKRTVNEASDQCTARASRPHRLRQVRIDATTTRQLPDKSGNPRPQWPDLFNQRAGRILHFPFA